MPGGIDINSTKKRVYNLTATALLCAIGIMIPMFFPSITLDPASFTLASHVPIFLAMFISPFTAVGVCIGTTLGFFFRGALPVVVARAATHLVFALIGAYLIKKKPEILNGKLSATLFAFIISVIHGVCELLVVIPFYFGYNLKESFYSKGFLVSVVLLVGLGTIIHSMVDFGISLFVWKVLRKTVNLPLLRKA